MSLARAEIVKRIERKLNKPLELLDNQGQSFFEHYSPKEKARNIRAALWRLKYAMNLKEDLKNKVVAIFKVKVTDQKQVQAVMIKNASNPQYLTDSDCDDEKLKNIYINIDRINQSPFATEEEMLNFSLECWHDGLSCFTLESSIHSALNHHRGLGDIFRDYNLESKSMQHYKQTNEHTVEDVPPKEPGKNIYAYLCHLYNDEKRDFKKNPKSYREKFTSFIETCEFPLTSENRTNFSIALSIQSLAQMKFIPSPKNKIKISSGNATQQRYVWTALMFMGSILAEKFDDKAIETDELDFYSILDKNSYFDPNKEIGWFSKFSSSSLYKTSFKDQINKKTIENLLQHSIMPDEDKNILNMHNYEDHLKEKYPSFIFGMIRSSRSEIAYGLHINYYSWGLYSGYDWDHNKLSGYHRNPYYANSIEIKLNSLFPEYTDSTSLIPTACPHTFQPLTYAMILMRLRYQNGCFGNTVFTKEPVDISYVEKKLEPSYCPMDGKLVKNSSFFEVDEHYTYTPGPLSCDWLEKNNQLFFKDVEQKKKQDEIIAAQKAAEKKKQEADEKEAAILKDIENKKNDEIRKTKEKEDRILKYNLAVKELLSPEKFTRSINEIEKLFELGASINYQDEEGYTPLMRAVNAKDDAIAEYLLNEGANPLLQSKYGKKASQLTFSNSLIYPVLKAYELRFAVATGDLKTVKIVCSVADPTIFINNKDDDGKTPLFIASEKSHSEIVDYLLWKGADYTLMDNNNKTPFDIATDNTISTTLFEREEEDKKSNHSFQM
ncbi:MAG: ankyrin repeat domain-containing protein [Gammaproteobacteria bacterium]|nr:ankyrin repeat domain-containing protein [Gammaproteobacteria bacterium]